MKKFYTLVFAALLVLPLLFSCVQKPEPEPTPNPPTPVVPPTPPTPPEPELIEFRKTIRFKDSVVSTNGSNDFVAVYSKILLTKGEENGPEIMTGSYTFDNASKTYNFTGFGKLELLDDSRIAFTPAGGTRQVYDAKITEIVPNETASARLMNRSWVTTQTILAFRGVNYTYTGDLDLNKVESDAREQKIDFKFHLDDNSVVTKVIITDALVAAYLKNGQSYAAEHDLRLGSEFKLEEYTYDLKGTAKVQFVDELCVITIDTVLDDSPATIYLTLKEAK